MSIFHAGAAAVSITPTKPLHLFGYPHVPRISTGVHDPLMSSALYLKNDAAALLFVANDIIFVPKDLAARARQRIAVQHTIPIENICITATHTHSGPDTVRYISNEADPSVPPPDAAYLQQLEDGIVAAAFEAINNVRPAVLGTAITDGSCVGGNRRDPSGPGMPEVPVLSFRDRKSQQPIALMLVCSMHPTVLHEDSTLISGDFPGMTRQYLQQHVVNASCPILHHTGACGNQSPRHVTRANTFEEAQRLGEALGQSIENALKTATYTDDVSLQALSGSVMLSLRGFPEESSAAENLHKAEQRYEQLKSINPKSPETRTAECDLFGAQETLTLARAAAEGRVAQAVQSCMPAEVQCFRIGPWYFIAFPGEVFVEFALAVREAYPNAFVMTLANGEMQGYLATAEAMREGGYEASNGLFKNPESGDALVAKAKELLATAIGVRGT